MLDILPGFEDWSDLDILTGLIFGESRGELTEGKIAVGLTVKTRVDNPRWWGNSIRSVCLAHKGSIAQFSCFLDINNAKIKRARELNLLSWYECNLIAKGILNNKYADTMGNPTHYHTIRIHPDWSSGMKRLATIGNHIFYTCLEVDK